MSCKIHDPSIKENKMKLKILICVLLLISTVFSVCGCVSSNEIEFEGVIYKKLSMKGHDPYMTVLSVSEDANEYPTCPCRAA